MSRVPMSLHELESCWNVTRLASRGSINQMRIGRTPNRMWMMYLTLVGHRLPGLSTIGSRDSFNPAQVRLR